MDKNKRLIDQVILITGASEGIGKAVALAVAAEGACPALVARTQVKLDELAGQISASGTQALVLPADVTRSQEVDRMVSQVVDHFGRIDVLVNNVGRGLRKPTIETNDAEWQQLVAENLSSTFYCCRAVLRCMQPQGHGLIVNLASRSGRVGEGALAAYSSVKAGVVGLTRALADEQAPFGIRVNAVCPGPVATERMQRLLPQVDKTNWLSPQDVAQAVLFLITSPGHTMQGATLDLF